MRSRDEPGLKKKKKKKNWEGEGEGEGEGMERGCRKS